MVVANTSLANLKIINTTLLLVTSNILDYISVMRRKSKSKKDDEWLKEFGRGLEQLILSRGYNSVYDFWKQVGHKYMSRASLNYIVAGEVDPRISTVKILTNILRIDNHELKRLFIDI